MPATSAHRFPPLILHPFSDAAAPVLLKEGARAGLMLEGLVPRNGTPVEELQLRLTAARYCEIKMLFYLGRDLRRWIGQCMEVAQREDAGGAVSEAAIARLLIDSAPETVVAKLKGWGVHEYRSLFSRALGLNALFAELPPITLLTREFLKDYYPFADGLFGAWTRLSRDSLPDYGPCEYEIYASGEYSRMLSEQWAEG